MMKKAVCEICKEQEHKYRCPQCRIVYCSLTCYKTHKESCSPIAENKKPDDQSQVTTNGEQILDYDVGEEETEDKVSLEQLKQLKGCPELKGMLGNPHLRQLMTSLVHAEDPGTQLEAAMQEPIFVEFADRCLELIDDDKENDAT